MSTQQRKRSEIQELQEQLAGQDLAKKKAGVRKIIDAMTRGKDVSMLFTDIVKNMATTDMEFKKLIYLYIINYAKSHPDLAILAINIFRKDAKDKVNPFLRALAVRTMGCIRVKQIADYLLDPLKSALKDEDSYVRKTAAICVAKLYDVAPELLEEQGFIKMLENLLNDGNAFVVSNTLAALTMIQEVKGQNMINLTSHIVQKLLTAINESSDWGQIYILDALACYTPSDSKEAENILERVVPRLAHQNSGAVLSAVKVIMRYLDFLNSPELIRSYCRKLGGPLVSLMSAEPEIVYINLRNLNLILQKRPTVLEKELKIFFCNFNDPIYIKLEKIEVMIRLANMDNIQQILHELKEYTNEVDVEFVKKAIRAVGRCAIKLDKAAKNCVQVLWECLKTRVSYVIQETIIVLRDIFRKYPQQYNGILKDICENLQSLDDPEAKSSMIWIIGEHVDLIDNADQLLENFLENFKEEHSLVQHQILTSCVKLFLTKPQDGHTIIQNLLQVITKQCENPDLRDRGFIYWRLIFTDPELAKRIVLADRPIISDQSYILETNLLDKLIENIGTLASVYIKAPEQFVKKLRDIQNQKELEEREDDQDDEQMLATRENNEYSDGTTYMEQATQLDDNNNNNNYIQNKQDKVQQVKQQIQQLNLLDDDDLIGGSTTANTNNNYSNQQVTQQPSCQPKQTTQTNDLFQDDFLETTNDNSNQFLNIKIPYNVVLNESDESIKNKITGLQIEAAFQREGPDMQLYLKILNRTNQTIQNFGIKFNLNPFKLQPNQIEVNINPIPQNQSGQCKILVNNSGQPDNNPPQNPFRVQVALNTNLDVFTFFIPCLLTVLLVQCPAMTPQEYVQFQQREPLAKRQDQIQTRLSAKEIQTKFVNNNLNLVGQRVNNQGIELYSFSCKTLNGMPITLDTILDSQNQILKLNFCTLHPSLLPLFMQAIGMILNL